MTGIALVTGAGNGIGKYSVLALSAAGFKPVLWGRRLEPLQAVAAESKGKAITVSTDVSDPHQVEELFIRTQQAFGIMKAQRPIDGRPFNIVCSQIATMPLSANVQFLTVMASDMPFIGRG